MVLGRERVELVLCRPHAISGRQVRRRSWLVFLNVRSIEVGFCVSRSQIRISPSEPPDAIDFPSGENASECIDGDFPPDFAVSLASLTQSVRGPSCMRSCPCLRHAVATCRRFPRRPLVAHREKTRHSRHNCTRTLPKGPSLSWCPRPGSLRPFRPTQTSRRSGRIGWTSRRRCAVLEAPPMYHPISCKSARSDRGSRLRRRAAWRRARWPLPSPQPRASFRRTCGKVVRGKPPEVGPAIVVTGRKQVAGFRNGERGNVKE